MMALTNGFSFVPRNNIWNHQMTVLPPELIDPNLSPAAPFSDADSPFAAYYQASSQAAYEIEQDKLDNRVAWLQDKEPRL